MSESQPVRLTNEDGTPVELSDDGTVRRPPEREPPDGGDEADAEPYPHTVVSIINGVAYVGLAVGLIAGLSLIVWGFGNGKTDEFTGNSADRTWAIFTGIGTVIAGGVYWAFFKAVTLGLTYLWRIQFELAHQAAVPED